jgi:hypothetical protein
MDSYKSQQEAFVSNLTGTSISCILACVTHIPLFVLLLKISQRAKKPSVLCDIMFLVIPTILITTVSTIYNYWTLPLLILFSVVVLRHDNTSLGGSFQYNQTKPEDVNNTYYLTLFKGAYFHHNV